MVKDFKIHMTEPRAQITDLDGLPWPDRSLVDYGTYHQYIGQAMVKHCISFQATRGCPYKCLYCHKIWPKKHVARSAQSLFEEVKAYYQLGIRRFAFVDDIFNLDIANSMKFFDLIIKNKLALNLLFPAGLRGDILTPEYIDRMIEAGTINFGVSLETASPRLQKLIGKHLNIDKLRENIEYICAKYPNVILELFTMHGFPSETEEEAMITLNFIKNLKWVHFPYVSILRIFPNTEMEELAIKSGISRELILRSGNLAYHELPETLPFDKSFTFNYQADFLHNYFLSKERLLQVLPYQMKVLTEDEIAQKYNSYLPGKISFLADILKFAGILEDSLRAEDCLNEASVKVPQLNQKLASVFPADIALQQEPHKNAIRVLLLDLSLYFSDEKEMLYDCVDAPLGLMCLMSYLQRELGPQTKGKIAKSRIDFDSYEELKLLLEEFQPHIIGIRTLTLFKDFFHEAAAMIRNWGIDVPIIAGGPYAASDYKTILQDANTDMVVLGEGEITFCQLIREMTKNNNKLPVEGVLEKIPGIAFVPGRIGAGSPVMEEQVGLDKKHRESLVDQFVDDLEDE